MEIVRMLAVSDVPEKEVEGYPLAVLLFDVLSRKATRFMDEDRFSLARDSSA